MRRVLCGMLVILCCVTRAASALAEVAFVPGLADWMLDEVPLELTLSADIAAYAPFDEDRLTQLTSLMQHLSLRLTRQPLVDETQSTIDLLVDGEEALGIGLQQTAQRTMAQFSVLPSVTYAGADPLATLLGASSEPFTLLGLDGSESEWLTDSYDLLNALEPVLATYLTSETNIKAEIKDMGTARLKQDYTVPKTDAPGLTELLLSVCPEGRMQDLVSKLVFSGKQTLRIYRNADHVPLRVEWNGTCGPGEDHLRNVKLTWRLRRDDTAYRDNLSLSSPALRGSDRNTLTWTCDIAPNKSGHMVLKCDLSYTRNVDRQKTIWSGSCKLTAENQGMETRVTGDATISRQLPDASSATSYTFTPDLTFSGDGNMPAVDGTLTVARMNGKKVLDQATLTVGLHRTEYTAWRMRESTVDLDLLDEATLDVLRQQATGAVSAALIRRLTLLPRGDLDYLFKDLPEESVQDIINAAQSH